jgi:hypothetical protein
MATIEVPEFLQFTPKPLLSFGHVPPVLARMPYGFSFNSRGYRVHTPTPSPSP